MKKVIGVILITGILICLHSIQADMKPMDDQQMDSIRGQAGIAAFNAVFAPGAELNKETLTEQQMSFDEMYARSVSAKQTTIASRQQFEKMFQKSTAGSDKTNSLVASRVNFDQSFVNIGGMKIFDGQTAHINYSVNMGDVSFAEAFQKTTGLDLGLGGTIFDEIQLHNFRYSIRGTVKVEFHP